MSFTIHKSLDTLIGSPVCFIIGWISWMFRRAEAKAPKNPQQILVIKVWAIGDAIASLPMIDSLHETYPHAKIDILARNRNKVIFQHCASVSEIYLLEPKHLLGLIQKIRSYDIVVDSEPWMNLSAFLAFLFGKYRVGFSHGSRGLLYTKSFRFTLKMHMVEQYLELAKLAGATKIVNTLTIQIPDSIKQEAQQLLEKNQITRPIILAPGTGESASITRKWSRERFSKLADQLAHIAPIIFVGGIGDIAEIEKIQQHMKEKSVSLAGKTNLILTAGLMTQARLVISVDSGPMHLAAAVHAPTLGLFGPNTPTLWKPWGPTGNSIYHRLPCSPCIQNEKGIMPDCSRTDEKYKCMNLIKPEEVLKKSKGMMKLMNPYK